MTFDTWWKEQGSLHRDIFNFPHEAREVFKKIAQLAWEESEIVTTDELDKSEAECTQLRIENKTLEEELEAAREDVKDARDDVETLKASIRSCL